MIPRDASSIPQTTNSLTAFAFAPGVLKTTTPQIFFNDEHIGGYDEIRALEKENKLLDLLK